MFNQNQYNDPISKDNNLNAIPLPGGKTILLGPARYKRGNLARVPRPWRGVTHGPPNNATCPLGDYETQR